jgi:YidC/Oxa1 family membrane protein insertase
VEKRLLLFVAMCFGVLYVHKLYWDAAHPRPARPVAQVAAEDDKPAAEEAVADNPSADPTPAEKPTSEAADPKPAQEGVAAEVPAAQHKRIVLGSLDADSPYRMAVTLNSVGATVERLELNRSRYRDLENERRPAYIGHFAPSESPDQVGALLNIVVTGSPAATAGIKAGDVITKIGDESVAGPEDLALHIAKHKPGQTIPVTVLRDGKSQSLDVHATREPLQLLRPEGLQTARERSDDDDCDPLSFLLALAKIDGQELRELSPKHDETEIDGAQLKRESWEVVSASEHEVAFRRGLPKWGLEVTKRYTLAARDPQVSAEQDMTDAPLYHLTLALEIKNVGSDAHKITYRLDGPTGMPLEGVWYASKVTREGTNDLRNVVAGFNGNAPAEFPTPAVVDNTSDKVQPRLDALLDWIALDVQYFSVALLPQPKDAADRRPWFHSVRPLVVGKVPTDAAKKRLTNVTFRLDSQPAKLNPGESLAQSFQIFAGPKRPHLLEQYSPPFSDPTRSSLHELVYYGWFGVVARPMLAILHGFYAIVSALGIKSYGLPIIMLTVLVRGLMVPLSRKQTQSSQKMAELQPEIKRINEKYKTDSQARGRATQELFRKNNYNPFGGCLLAFVQLPIFVGLYRSLGVDVELRQSPLLMDASRWCGNLAAPDMLWRWDSVMPPFLTNMLGPYLNVLPLVTMGLFLWQQQKMMPPPTDEQSAMQQKMMKYMMIFMGFMFFKVAAGLCIYFIASSLWGICERKFLPKPTPATVAARGR